MRLLLNKKQSWSVFLFSQTIPTDSSFNLYSWIFKHHKLPLSSLNTLLVTIHLLHNQKKKSQDMQTYWTTWCCIWFYWPVLILRYGGEWRVQAVCVVGHVTFITQQLFIRILLYAADVAVAPATVFIRIVLAVFALRSIWSCRIHAFNILLDIQFHYVANFQLSGADLLIEIKHKNRKESEFK